MGTRQSTKNAAPPNQPDDVVRAAVALIEQQGCNPWQVKDEYPSAT